MIYFKKIDHYLLTNHPVLWRTKVHYFVLFSLILGNVAAAFVRIMLEVTDAAPDYPDVLGVMVISCLTLRWIISQVRPKINYYRFWDEVLTFSVYMLCAVSLYVNLMVLTGESIFDKRAGGYQIDDEVLLSIGIYMFIAATMVYLIAHTKLINILGIALIHLVMIPLIGVIPQTPFLYIITLATLYIIFYKNPDNDSISRFMRLFLIPFIPICMTVTWAYLYSYLYNAAYNLDYWTWLVLPVMVVATILGSAFILKHNVEPFK